MIATIFLIFSVLAIMGGGLISVFTARKPTRQTAWVSAYLVLVVGIIQLGLVSAWHKLGQPETGMMLAALIVYNFGNASIIAGTLLKKQLSYYLALVNLGGALIALAMALLLTAVRNSSVSWTLAGFIVLVVIILISMPIGLVLSSRRR